MSKQFRPEPPPQNDLERMMRKAADDPALHGRMFRMLWDSELYTYIPDHPEMHGAHSFQNGDKMRFTVYEHREGPFIAVFTSEAAAHWAGAHFPSPKPAIACMPAHALFKTVNDGKTWVRVNHQLRSGITLEPQGVDALVQGEYTHTQPRDPEPTMLTVYPMPAEEVPAKLRQAIRVFCVQRPLALGVYAFHPEDARTGKADEGELRLIVWLRDEKNDLFNDFLIMVEKLRPPYLRVNCAGVTSDATASVEYLQSCTPLWPVV
ncbi:MAG TPA: SseB family protein [Chthoniobacteraceae bacterium]|jgi:hypothetical protein|nr:SseB family protein [Chthoniobacteraceae bacterium]